MSGSIQEYGGAYYVSWYNRETKKMVKIYRYKGEKLYHIKTAQKLLGNMQSDVEDGVFFLDKFTKKEFSDVLPFIETWLKNIKGSLSPATYKGYKSYVENHIKPYFKKYNQLTLPDIQLNILRDFKNSINLAPKSVLNVMYCMHTILDEAKRSRRILHMPSFPKKKEYQLIKKPILWLPESRQLALLDEIPEEHQPIFYFLKYHLRRPAEACALQKEDYADEVFTISRSISARKIVNKTKTGEIHTIPMHPDFERFLDIEKKKQIKSGIVSSFFFVNPNAKKPGKRYTNESLNIIWKAACKKAKEDIDLYSGLKHSSCSQYINEKGLSESELQIITDHARLESVKSYAKTEVKRKKELMLKNIFNLDKKKKTERKKRGNFGTF